MSPDVAITISTIEKGSENTKRVTENLKKLKSETTVLVPGLENARKSLTQFASANAALIGVLVGVGTALNKSFNDYIKYAGEVRDLALVQKQGAEEASRFIQVLDDYELTVQDAMAATRALKDKGLVPSIDTLAKLADEYKSIQDPAKQMIFIQDNLGRGGVKWINVLNQEGDALRKQAAAVQANLVLSDLQIAKAERERLAVDKLKDSWQGFWNSIGAGVGEIILQNDEMHRAIELLHEQGIVTNRGTIYTQEYRDALGQVRTEMDKETKVLKGGIIPALDETVEATKSLYDESILNTILSTKDATAEYRDTVKSLDTSLADGTISAEEHAAGITAAGEAYSAATTDIIFGLTQMTLAADGWQAADTAAILSIGESLGKFSAEEAAVAQTTISNAQLIVAAHAGITQEMVNGHPAQMQVLAELDGALAEGTLQAQNYKEQVDHIRKQVLQLDGMEATATINILVNGAIPRFGSTTSTVRAGGGASSNAVRKAHAGGGDFIIPSVYGNEGFRMGNNDTASAGERVTITPKDEASRGKNNGDISMASMRIMSKMFAAEISKVLG